MPNTLASTEEIIADLRAGKMVILVDEEDRENEGDLVLAADHVTAEAVNFMAKHGRGLICLTLTRERCQQLNLPLMVRDNGTSMGTNFTVSIEAATGVTTGISAADRALTIKTAVAPNAKPSDLVQPGHIFPLMAQPGGVLIRSGHTEAGCDLAAMAGCSPTSVICEIMKDDGSMARLPDLLEFAKEHQLKIGSIADLIQYRSQHESIVVREGTREFETPWGKFQGIGMSYQKAGFESVGEFVRFMVQSEDAQFEGSFVAFIINLGVQDELQRHDWAGYARKYYGPGYARNGYDAKLNAAYERRRAAMLAPPPEPVAAPAPAAVATENGG